MSLNLLFEMNCIKLCFIVLTLTGMVQTEETYKCGIRKNFISLVHGGWTVAQGQWPWHVGIHHASQEGIKYACGGSLIDQKHIVTAAHCVINRETNYPMPTRALELRFGQTDLSQEEKHVQRRDVSKIHVHPEYTTHRNDIAVLELRVPVEFTDFVIPICMERNFLQIDKNLRNLKGQRGWITGWGMTNNDTESSKLKSASLPVVDYRQCVQDNPILFGSILNSKMFCAGDRNGTSPGTGDSGGGMYFNDGDRWVLRGIVSFAKQHETKLRVDTSTYAVFVKVERFITWIQEKIEDKNSNLTAEGVTKRISDKECDRFQSYIRRSSNGMCSNARSPHTVIIAKASEQVTCTGILVNENHVLTAGQCIQGEPTMVQIHDYGTINISTTIRHPKHMFRRRYYDIAIIRLASSIILSYNVVPACLASDRTENLYDNLLTTGFHTVHHTVTRPASSSRTDKLVTEYISISQFFSSDASRVIPTDECSNIIGSNWMLRHGIDPASQLCALNSDILSTNGPGSAGSPLQTINKRTCMPTVIGVLNFGSVIYWDRERTEKDVMLDVYARVSYFLDWIEQTVWSETAVLQTTTEDLEESTTEQLSSRSDF